MKQPPKLVVTPFENRNGVISYRVVGWINGERVRKNFKTRAEASAEKTALEIGAVQAANGMQMVATKLTIEQVRDAEVCGTRRSCFSPPTTRRRCGSPGPGRAPASVAERG